jgi:hypothetical protein
MRVRSRRTPYSATKVLLRSAAGLPQIRICGQWQFASGGLGFCPLAQEVNERRASFHQHPQNYRTITFFA